jgi:hypothetical protein
MAMSADRRDAIRAPSASDVVPSRAADGSGLPLAAPSQRSIRRRWVAFLSLVLVGCLLAGGGVWWCCHGWTEEMLERLIREEIPANSGREEVEAWFDRHGIPYTYFGKTTRDREGEKTMPQLAGLRDEDLSGMVRGEISGPDANVSLFFSGHIEVYFFFDKKGRLAGHLILTDVYDYI